MEEEDSEEFGDVLKNRNSYEMFLQEKEFFKEVL